MRFFLIFLISLSLFSFVGCTGRHCIKIGGTYEGIDGNLEYCWDEAKSADAGVPVLSGDSGTLFGFLDKDINDLLLMIATDTATEETKAKEVVSPAKRLFKKIKEFRTKSK